MNSRPLTATLPVLASLICLAFSACQSSTKTPYVRYRDSGPSKTPPVKTEKRDNGLLIEDLRFGSGDPAQVGDIVYMHFTGWLGENGEKFDSTVDRGTYLEYQFGVQSINPGWDEGIQGMRIGGRRRLTIPPTLGFGSDEVGPVPPNSTLIYEIVLLGVKGKS